MIAVLVTELVGEVTVYRSGSLCVCVCWGGGVSSFSISGNWFGIGNNGVCL